MAYRPSGQQSPFATRLAPRKGLKKRRPFLGLHPGFTAPPPFLLIGTLVQAIYTGLCVAAWRDFGFGWGAPPLLWIALVSSEISGARALTNFPG